MFSLRCLAFICKERADHNIYYTVCTVYTCISLSMFSNLSLPWEHWPNHTKHVNLDLNIWKWVIDHSYFHEGELHGRCTSPVAQGGSFVQRQRMPWWSSLKADDDPRYRWTFDFFSTGGLVQGHGKSSWRSGTRPMFLGIAPGMGSWTGAGTVLDHVFLGFHYFHCLLCVCVELHRGSPMRFQSVVGKAMARISSGELNPCPCPQLGAKQ